MASQYLRLEEACKATQRGKTQQQQNLQQETSVCDNCERIDEGI